MINDLDTDDRRPPARLVQAVEIDRALFGQEFHIRKQEMQWVREALTYCLKIEGANGKETCNHLTRQYLKMLRTHKTFGFHELELLKYKQPPPGTPDMRSERIQKTKYLTQEYDQQAEKLKYMSREERDRLVRIEFNAPQEGQMGWEKWEKARKEGREGPPPGTEGGGWGSSLW